MSDAMSRDDLVVAVNRLMICAMEDIDCGRDEAGPTTLDLVERIEAHDAALRAALAEAQREKARVFSVTAIGHDGCGKDHSDHLPEFNVCWICKWEAAEAERDRLAKVARACARELSYVAEVEPVGGPLLAHTGEGDACVALVEKLCGPMETWPIEEENAQEMLRAAPAGEKENRSVRERLGRDKTVPGRPGDAELLR